MLNSITESQFPFNLRVGDRVRMQINGGIRSGKVFDVGKLTIKVVSRADVFKFSKVSWRRYGNPADHLVMTGSGDETFQDTD